MTHKTNFLPYENVETCRNKMPFVLKCRDLKKQRFFGCSPMKIAVISKFEVRKSHILLYNVERSLIQIEIRGNSQKSVCQEILRL